jgi:EAL domain-containing protein (putative c-di-GMP-specific phosphodiesterase class I)
MLAAILAKRRKLAPRTLIEITETAAIADLESAGKAIASLRAMGYRVGLDDSAPAPRRSITCMPSRLIS